MRKQPSGKTSTNSFTRKQTGRAAMVRANAQANNLSSSTSTTAAFLSSAIPVSGVLSLDIDIDIYDFLSQSHRVDGIPSAYSNSDHICGVCVCMSGGIVSVADLLDPTSRPMTNGGPSVGDTCRPGIRASTRKFTPPLWQLN